MIEQVRRSLEFVADELGPDDRLSVVRFSADAEVLMPLTLVGTAWLRRVRDVFRGLQAGVELPWMLALPLQQVSCRTAASKMMWPVCCRCLMDGLMMTTLPAGRSL